MHVKQYVILTITLSNSIAWSFSLGLVSPFPNQGRISRDVVGCNKIFDTFGSLSSSSLSFSRNKNNVNCRQQRQQERNNISQNYSRMNGVAGGGTSTERAAIIGEGDFGRKKRWIHVLKREWIRRCSSSTISQFSESMSLTQNDSGTSTSIMTRIRWKKIFMFFVLVCCGLSSTFMFPPTIKRAFASTTAAAVAGTTKPLPSILKPPLSYQIPSSVGTAASTSTFSSIVESAASLSSPQSSMIPGLASPTIAVSAGSFQGLTTRAEIALSLRLIYASLVGGIIGLERSTSDNPAGVRTMALVSLGACAFTICSTYGFLFVPLLPGGEGVKVDPSRLCSNVISGVGFIGAGVITNNMRSGNKSYNRGLTTASAIWVAAAIGIATGLGLYFVAGATAVSTIAILSTGKIIKCNNWKNGFIEKFGITPGRSDIDETSANLQATPASSISGGYTVRVSEEGDQRMSSPSSKSSSFSSLSSSSLSPKSNQGQTDKESSTIEQQQQQQQQQRNKSQTPPIPLRLLNNETILNIVSEENIMNVVSEELWGTTTTTAAGDKKTVSSVTKTNTAGTNSTSYIADLAGTIGE